MGTLFLIFMAFVLCLFVYIQYDKFMKKHNKVQTGTIFNAEDMPTVFDEAVEQLKDGGL